MDTLKHAESFRDLMAYQNARELQSEVFLGTKLFPKDEKYSLSDQIRRSSRAIGAKIAEAWVKRRYAAHFVSKLTDADGEQYETQHWIETAVECGYIDAAKGRLLIEKCKLIGRLLGGMMSKADLFCGKLTKEIREECLEYFEISPNDTD